MFHHSNGYTMSKPANGDHATTDHLTERARIDHNACLVCQRIDSFIRLARFLAGIPAALPLAFVAGILADRLRAPGFKYIYGLLAGLVGQVKAMRAAPGTNPLHRL